MVLQEDRDWLNNIRDMQEHREKLKHDAHSRLISTYQEILAERITTTLPNEISDELSEEDRLALGQATFEAVGEDHWRTLMEEEDERLKETGRRATERLPELQDRVAERMIEEVGQSQVETWARHAAGVAPA